jgi:hypothetical protein
MRIAILSDIQANYHALEATLAAACCAVVGARGALCLAGDHDLAVIRALSVCCGAFG